MEINNIKWTEKSILTGKTLFVIPLALVINSVLFRLGDSLLYRLLPISAVYTAAMWVFCGVSLAASTILSVKVLKFFYNKMLERMDADTAAEYLRRESKFKWHLLFTIGLYFLTMMVIFAVCGAVIVNFGLAETDSSVPPAVPVAVVAIVTLVLMFFAAKKLHWHMIQVTATNAELIDEVYCGLHDEQIPNGVTRPDIIGVLYNAAAYSVTTAAIVHVAVTTLKKFGKLMLKCLGIGALIGIVLGLLGADAMDRWADDMIQSNRAAREAADQQNKAYAAWKGATDDAKKQAQFSYRQAQKAYNYNPNSYDAYRKTNLFKNDYFKYQDIKKNRP